MNIIETQAPAIRTFNRVIDGVQMTETHCNGRLVAFSLEAVPTVAEVLADDLYTEIEGWPRLANRTVGEAIEHLKASAFVADFSPEDVIVVFGEVYDIDTPEATRESIKAMGELASTLTTLCESSNRFDRFTLVKDMAKPMR